MKILVCGGRDYNDQERCWSILDKAHSHYKFSCLIEGGAKGADYLAKTWAQSRQVPIQSFPADWKRFGKRAGPIRNQQMIDEGSPDVVIAFPGGNGTQDMINRAKSNKIPVIIIE